jgi:hypothetical protein
MDAPVLDGKEHESQNVFHSLGSGTHNRAQGLRLLVFLYALSHLAFPTVIIDRKVIDVKGTSITGIS